MQKAILRDELQRTRANGNAPVARPKANAEQRAAIDLIYGRLPKFMQTRSVRQEMTRNVIEAAAHYEEAAVACALDVYDRLEKQGRVKLFG